MRYGIIRHVPGPLRLNAAARIDASAHRQKRRSMKKGKKRMGGPGALAQIATLAELFAWRVDQTPEGEAYRQFDVLTGEWISYTWAHMSERIAKWRNALGTLQLFRGARVAILLPNGVDAVCIDQATLALGMVPVPMHAIDNPGSIAYVIQDCDASVLVVASRAQWDAIAAVGDPMPLLRLVVVTEQTTPPRQDLNAQDDNAVAVVALPEWLASGKVLPQSTIVSGDSPGATLAALVYTSGTTGKPKGVMLTHNNILSNVRAVLSRVTVLPSDLFLSFLPLSHTFERTVGYYLAIATGSCVAYARSVAQIREDLKIVRPTVLVSVPRIYERFYGKLQEMLDQSGPVARTLFTLAQTVGWRRFSRRQKLPAEGAEGTLGPGLDWLLAPLLQRLVARKVLDQFGGRLRFAVCGGAPLSQAVAQCFLGLGLPLLQGYGMTETSPIVSANSLDDNWPATAGKPLDGVHVRIGEHNELQVRGHGVMQGYWKRPGDSARAMTEDGWLHTGDQAAIEDGHIRIIGRIKEIIVTSTGEKIAPADLELAIIADPLVEQAFVIGEGRQFIAAFVVLNRERWQALAAELKVDANDGASLDSDAVRTAVLGKIRQETRGFPAYAMPRAVRIELNPWSIQNGLMTPTLKLKRNALQAHFRGEIEDVYAKRPAA